MFWVSDFCKNSPRSEITPGAEAEPLLSHLAPRSYLPVEVVRSFDFSLSLSPPIITSFSLSGNHLWEEEEDLMADRRRKEKSSGNSGQR